MSKTSKFIFTVVTIVAWLIFVGLCIEAGALIFNFIYSIFKPEIVGHLYQKLNLTKLYQQNQWVFYSMYSFALFISVLKACLFYVVINLLQKFDLNKPFSSFVSKKITLISSYTFFIGILSIIARHTAKNMVHYGYEFDKLNEFWEDGHPFILMAAVIYIISLIFKKGVELQTENDLIV